MVTVRQQVGGLLDEVLLEIRDLAAYAHGAQGGLPPDVWVGCVDAGLDFGEKIPRHFDGGNVAQGTEGEADDILVGMGEVAVSRSQQSRVAWQASDGLCILFQ